MPKILGLGLGVALLGLLGVRVFVLPGIVRAKVAERAARLGLDVSVDGVSAGLGSTELTGLTLKRASDGALLGTVVSVDVSGGPLGASANEVSVTEPHLSLDVSDLRALMDAQRAAASRAAASAASAPGVPRRVLHVKGLALAIADTHGPLVSAEDGVAERAADGSAQLSLGKVELGAEPHETIALAELEAKLAPSEGVPLLASLSVAHGQLRWAAETAETAAGRLLPRLRALRAALAPSAPASDASSAAGSATAALASGRKMWTDDATVRLDDINVTDVDSERPIMSKLGLQVQASAKGVFTIRGQGVAPGDGRVAVDLRVEPKALRTEGDIDLRRVPLELFVPVLPPLPFDGLSRTKVDAKLSLSGQGLSAISARGELVLTDLALASPRLAHLPVGPVTVAMRGEGTWKPATRELADLKASLDLGAVHVTTTGSIAWPADGYDVELSLALPKSPCNAVLRAVPAGLLDELSGVVLSGDITARIDASVHAGRLDDTKLVFDIKDHCRFAEVTPILDVRRFERPFVHRVVEPDDTVYEFETGPGSGAWTPIEQISPFMTQAAIAHEDGRFLGHHGFAPKEIGAALARNLKARAFRFGASTITMQLVKNVFLHREKLLARKLQEAFIVWWLEQHWDKRRILELYLNVIEYGPALYGIRQAALHYFGVTPYELTPAQSAYLASILPNPKGYYEYFEKGKLSESMKTRMVKFLEHMRERNRIDDEALRYGLEETAAFTFYDPNKPPPPPRPMRGQAEPLPFGKAGGMLPGWDDGAGFQEDGSFR
jgi:hypothetical protein